MSSTSKDKIMTHQYRFVFRKTEVMRYTGHLDLHHAWQKTFRRAGISVQHSQGFHPLPKIQLAAALPLGFTGENEMMDVWIEDDRDPEILMGLLNHSLPPGIELKTIEMVVLKER
jgi:radical SAM-linked protein